MALVPRGPGSGFYATLSMTDTQGQSSTLRYAMNAIDFATAQADLPFIIAGVTGVSQSVCTMAQISYVEEEDNFVHPVNADNSQRARITFQLAGKSQKATLDIPAPENGIFQTPSGEGNLSVDILDPEVVAFGALFQSGGKCFISDGDLSQFIIRGKRTVR